MDELKLHPEAAKSLRHWHEMVARKDLSAVAELLDADATFRSPMAHHPYPSAPVVATILQTVVEIFEDFTYQRQLATPDGLNVVLEFGARVGSRELKGVDLIRFDERGKIVEFEVMIRPMSGLSALAEQMAQRLAPFLASHKAG
jgi:hypothetical protein